MFIPFLLDINFHCHPFDYHNNYYRNKKAVFTTLIIQMPFQETNKAFRGARLYEEPDFSVEMRLMIGEGQKMNSFFHFTSNNKQLTVSK